MSAAAVLGRFAASSLPVSGETLIKRPPRAGVAFASLRVWLQRHEALAAVAILAWLAATAWARPLWLPDEGRYVGVAWEMLRSGDWLTPRLDGLPFFHKPPL